MVSRRLSQFLIVGPLVITMSFVPDLSPQFLQFFFCTVIGFWILPFLLRELVQYSAVPTERKHPLKFSSSVQRKSHCCTHVVIVVWVFYSLCSLHSVSQLFRCSTYFCSFLVRIMNRMLMFMFAKFASKSLPGVTRRFKGSSVWDHYRVFFVLGERFL